MAGDHGVELEARSVERVGALERGAPVFAKHRERPARKVRAGNVEGSRVGG